MLYYSTVTDLLKESLALFMKADIFNSFRLVGGTALSLQLGHRMSVDIDLFTDEAYGSIDFNKIEQFLHHNFKYVDHSRDDIISFGKSYFVGEDSLNAIKLDIYYTDPFIEDYVLIDGIRFATINEIIAMKMDVISRGGRKKDFWDLHELIEKYTFKEMLELHQKRHPYTHQNKELTRMFTYFEEADDDFEPICLKNKYWELIKLDLEDFVK